MLLLLLLQNFFGMAPSRRTPTPAGPSGDTSQGAGSQHEGSTQQQQQQQVQQQQQQQQQGGSGKDVGRMWAPPAEAPTEQQVRLGQVAPLRCCYTAVAAHSTMNADPLQNASAHSCGHRTYRA
jgi:transcription initiation factor TFIID subunit TAF12